MCKGSLDWLFREENCSSNWNCIDYVNIWILDEKPPQWKICLEIHFPGSNVKLSNSIGIRTLPSKFILLKILDFLSSFASFISVLSPSSFIYPSVLHYSHPTSSCLSFTIPIFSLLSIPTGYPSSSHCSNLTLIFYSFPPSIDFFLLRVLRPL